MQAYMEEEKRYMPHTRTESMWYYALQITCCSVMYLKKQYIPQANSSLK